MPTLHLMNKEFTDTIPFETDTDRRTTPSTTARLCYPQPTAPRPLRVARRRSGAEASVMWTT